MALKYYITLDINIYLHLIVNDFVVTYSYYFFIKTNNFRPLKYDPLITLTFDKLIKMYKLFMNDTFTRVLK